MQSPLQKSAGGFHRCDIGIEVSYHKKALNGLFPFRAYQQLSCYGHDVIIFFHPDYTVGSGISPDHTLRLAGSTAGRELHPALKIFSFYVHYYTPACAKMQEY